MRTARLIRTEKGEEEQRNWPAKSNREKKKRAEKRGNFRCGTGAQKQTTNKQRIVCAIVCVPAAAWKEKKNAYRRQTYRRRRPSSPFQLSYVTSSKERWRNSCVTRAPQQISRPWNRILRRLGFGEQHPPNGCGSSLRRKRALLTICSPHRCLLSGVFLPAGHPRFFFFPNTDRPGAPYS